MQHARLHFVLICFLNFRICFHSVKHHAIKFSTHTCMHTLEHTGTHTHIYTRVHTRTHAHPMHTSYRYL